MLLQRLFKKGNENDIQKSLEVIRAHHLYSHGLKTFSENKEIKSRILQEMIQYLISKKEFKQALNFLVFEKSNAKLVIECCKKIMDWKTGYKYLKANCPSEVVVYLQDMNALFIKAKAYEQAAKINQKLKTSISKILSLFLKARNYKKSKACLTGNHLNSEEENECKREIKLAASIELTIINQNLQNLIYWKNRLEFVQRVKGTQQNEEGFDGPADENMSYQSKLSTVSFSSQDSKVSKFTGMSLHFKAKNKKPKNLISRKHKEGSLYEEDWLVQSLNNLDIDENQMKEWSHLFVILIRFGLMKELNEIKESIKTLVKKLRRGHSEKRF